MDTSEKNLMYGNFVLTNLKLKCSCVIENSEPMLMKNETPANPVSKPIFENSPSLTCHFFLFFLISYL